METKVKKAISDELRSKAFAIRREVFIVEQQVDEVEEFDQYEDKSSHFVALDSENNPIGASRWRRTSKGIKLERFAVKKTYRGQGIGSSLVQATLADISENADNNTYIYMHAQLEAMPLYEKFGFSKKGEMFEECNIQHYLMYKYL